MHLGILPFQIYISSKTYVLKDKTLYILLQKKKEKKKKDFMCDRNFNKTFILQTAMAL